MLSGLARERCELAESDDGFLRIQTDTLLTFQELVPSTVQEKADKLLQAIARNSKDRPGAPVCIDPPTDYPWAYAADGKELMYYTDHLRQAELIGCVVGPHYFVTVKGWERVEKLKESRATSVKVFVAMHFTAALQDLYDKGIKAGVEEAGYSRVRVDREEHIGKADDYIIVKIKESRVMVADMTGQRQSVYFEAGFARGLGLRIVWLCRDDDVENLHFDIRQYNHLLWKQGEWQDLKEKLRYRIEATIGRGPVKPTPES